MRKSPDLGSEQQERANQGFIALLKSTGSWGQAQGLETYLL